MQHVVITASKNPGIGNGLTYESSEPITPGTPVQIPLRQAMVTGVVVASGAKQQQEYDLKAIHKILHHTPLLSEPHIRTAQWMAEYYGCSLRQAIGPFLPGKDWQQLLPKPIAYCRLLEAKANVRGAKQQAVLAYLEEHSSVSLEKLRSETGVSLATLRSLESSGMIECYEEASDTSNHESKATVQRPQLTPEQDDAYQAIKGTKQPTLLFGVTGSGKTEVYAQLIADCLEQGKQAMLLVPEILLTEHSIGRFEQLLGGRERIAVIHSKLTSAKKRQLWQRVHQGQIDLVIGSRSALFAPLSNLGLIAIDEEHEWTYKNEQTPRYHARLVAEKLCQETGATLVLGSATPCLESWEKTKSGQYQLARLPERYGQQTLPMVKIVDLAEVQFGSLYPFSPTLLDHISDRLAKQEQTVLFLNRRGSATALLCLDCRRRVVSPDSQLPFSVHRHQDGTAYLVDHTSGLVGDIPTTCPGCQSNRLQMVGAGTQRVEDLLKQRFPQARLLRADKDTLTHPDEMRALLEAMRNNEADILLGTQMVVKGLDLPNVTLAGVLVADVGLSLPHFRAGERIFQLLTQLTGRSGRAKPGEVIIQTFRPEAPEVALAARHATEEYLEQELKLRLHTQYPPGTQMIRLIARGHEAEATIKRVYQQIQALEAPGYHCTHAATLFGGGRVWHLLLRGANPKQLIAAVNLDGCLLDVDPMECV